MEALVDESPVRIVRPAGQRLNSRIPGCNETYSKSFKGNIKHHRLIERLHDAHTGPYSASIRARKVIVIDEEGKAYMRHAEKVCRKLKCCRIAFSPEDALWIRRVQVHHSLLRFHKGKIKNRGNLKCAARCCNIPTPFQLSLQDIAQQLQACKRECMFYQEHGKRFWRKHQESWNKIAEENGDEEAFSRICAIIQREHQQDFWQKLNFVTGKKQTWSATTIQVQDQCGAIMERNTQDSVEQSIFQEVHEKCYTLAGEAPICNGILFREFGYTANTSASKAVLDGRYVAPADLDRATSELFAVIAAIRRFISENTVSAVITSEQWRQYWKIVNKESSSSEGVDYMPPK